MVKRRKRIWQWQQGAKVTLDYDPERKGVILVPGDEVSEVKFLDDGKAAYVPNNHLVPEN